MHHTLLPCVHPAGPAVKASAATGTSELKELIWRKEAEDHDASPFLGPGEGEYKSQRGDRGDNHPPTHPGGGVRVGGGDGLIRKNAWKLLAGSKWVGGPSPIGGGGEWGGGRKFIFQVASRPSFFQLFSSPE